MKTIQKGSTAAVITGIIAVLLIIWGIYAYSNDEAVAPVTTPTATSTASSTMVTVASTSVTTTVTTPATASKPATATSASLQQYTDGVFGFSFWYPSTWQVSKVSADAKTDGNITEGKIVATLVVGPKDAAGNTIPKFTLQEVAGASGGRITDTYGTGSNQTYFFSASLNTWMTIEQTGSNPGVLVAANVSNNTMGGLHMLGGIPQPNQNIAATIVPINTQNYVVVNALSAFDQNPLAATIMALDPYAAAPASALTQQNTVQVEGKAYASSPAIAWNTYTDPVAKFSIQYPTSFGAASFGQLQAGMPQFFTTSTTTNINANGCYATSNDAGKVDPGTSVNVNGIAFCHSIGGGVGAGQRYQDDYYTVHHNSTYVTVSYQVNSPNGCSAYQGSPTYAACSYFFTNYSTIVGDQIQKSIATFKFN